MQHLEERDGRILSTLQDQSIHHSHVGAGQLQGSLHNRVSQVAASIGTCILLPYMVNPLLCPR